MRVAYQKARLRHNQVVTRVRLLIVELALRCHQSDFGHGPARLDELMPKYLSRVPQDPFSGQPLVYRPQGTNWLLYSIGPDEVDNGGKPAGRPAPGSNGIAKGDLFFDSP